MITKSHEKVTIRMTECTECHALGRWHWKFCSRNAIKRCQCECHRQAARSCARCVPCVDVKEPQIHSHIEDVLDDKHPLAFETIYCKGCKCMVHAVNNECMQRWVETGRGNYCLWCFSVLTIEYEQSKYTNTVDHSSALEDDWGLPE